MDSRTILPVLLQWVAIAAPAVVSIVIAVAGLAVAGAAKGYNTHVKDVYVRDVVATAVKQAEMLLGGNSEAKEQQVLDRLSVLLPWLSHADASRLLEAAVMDLNQFQALTSGSATVLPTSPPLEPATVGYSAAILPAAPPQVLKLQIEHTVTGPAVMSQNPAPPPPLPEGTTLPLGARLIVGGGLTPVTASSTAPQAVAPLDVLPEPPLPQG